MVEILKTLYPNVYHLSLYLNNVQPIAKDNSTIKPLQVNLLLYIRSKEEESYAIVHNYYITKA